MPFSTIAGAVIGGVASAGASAAIGSMTGGGGGGSAAGAADPFAGQRGQYQTMLSDLINNPSSITSQPGYQFNLDQGLKSVQGSAAANGMLNSGNVLSSLQTYGQNYAQSQLTNQELLLAQLAGANVGSPGTAGQIMAGQQAANQQAASALGNQIGGAVGQGVGGLFGSSGGYSGGNPFATDTSGYGAGANTYGFTSGVSDPSSGVGYGFGA
jgi:hypothetical protein